MKYTVAIIEDRRYQEHHPGEGHPESPGRLAVIHDLIEREYHDLPRVTPRIATAEELALVHDPDYIARVAETEGKGPVRLDMDTGVSARSYEIARLAVGGLLQAVDRLFHTPNSKLDTPNSIFALVRPPGHHAEHDRAMGFCLFNNIAIAAQYAKQQYGVKKILIVDWDLHHGNGTQHAFYQDPGVLFFSSHQYPYYPGSGNYDEVGSGAGEGFTINVPLPTGCGDPEYTGIYRRILQPVALEYEPELVFVSAGFDPYFKDPLGGMRVTGEGFGALTRILLDIALRTCSGKIILALEGGYNPDGLREGAREVLNALLGKEIPPSGLPESSSAEFLREKITQIQKKYWKSLS